MSTPRPLPPSPSNNKISYIIGIGGGCAFPNCVEQVECVDFPGGAPFQHLKKETRTHMGENSCIFPTYGVSCAAEV